MSATQSTTSAKCSDQGVIETFRAYNRTQLKKIADMENVTMALDNDDTTTVDGRSPTEITETHEKLRAENAELKDRINKLEQEKESLEAAAVEARVLVLEVAERHDIIVKLKNELNEMEQLLMQKDTHIQFKDEIIRELRQQRRGNFKCPHNLIGKTKLNSIDKVVDLIRTVSRDISPDSSKDCCDCTAESCRKKENQKDETNVARNMDKNSQTDEDDYYWRQIESQQAEIVQLSNELEKTKLNYDRIYKSYNALNQQLDSITSLHSENSESQIGKMVSATVDSGLVGGECTTAIADKTHLANLITSLKTELATANSLLKMKEKECNDSMEHFKRNANELREARKRITTMEKQSENYRKTIRYLQENLNTHSDTIKKLEENHTILKSQLIDSQEKQKNYQKIFDENRKLESDLKHQLTTITFLRNALEDHLKLEKNAALKTINRTTTTVIMARSQSNGNNSTAAPAPAPTATTTTTSNSSNNSNSTRNSDTTTKNPIQLTAPIESSSTSLNRSTANTKWNWWKS